MPKSKDKLMIIDGNALVHRSFHALPPTMKTKSGEITNAVYGFASFLIKAIRELKPEYVVLTMDKKAPTFRHKMYKEYKAKRIKAPDELYAQIPKIKILAKSFNIPIFEMSGFEADDLIGTITKTVDKKIEKIIVTGDMDTLQLVDDSTKVYTMSRGIAESIVYDKNMVKARYGIAPNQLIDYKALRGDPSDNIPGVPGIGEKTAVELLKKFTNLDNIYNELKTGGKKIKKVVSPRIIKLLEENEKQAYMSKKLATIKRDIKINFNLKKTLFKDLNPSDVVKMLSELEFKSLLPRAQALFKERLNTGQENKKAVAEDKFERNKKKFKYALIDNEKKFNLFLRALKQQKYFTFDTETSGFDPLTADLLGISFSWKTGEAYYLETRNVGENTLFNYKNNQKDQNSWLEKLKPIFKNEKIKKYAHNLKFDLRVMRNSGLEINGELFDTMIASYLLNPGSRQHNLDALAFSELGFEKISKDDLLGKGRDKISFSEVKTENLSLYSCEDADFTMRLGKKLARELKAQKLEKLFNALEMPLVKVLSKMEDNGILIKKNILENMGVKLGKKLRRLEKNIYKQAKTKFNINSTKQLKEILFQKLEIPTDNIAKTKTGFSTSASELIKLKSLHPIIPLIQEYRELNKLTTTYIYALPKLINKKTKRVHTSFNQTITATGRLSSTDPNLQNIPVRTELGREIRRAFTAPKDSILASLDYSQIELRLAAHMSGDKKMIKAFNAGADIHTATAAEINQISPEEVTKKTRQEAKAINFGVLYGQGPHGLSQTADIPYARAKDFIDEYFNVYAGIKKFIDETVKKTRELGYAETMFGRRRYLPEINSSMAQARRAAERMAINTPIQGTAADMIKMAMIEIDKILKQQDIKMLLQVHDELLFEIKSGQEQKYIKQIKEIMENVIKLKIPIIADVKIGKNWGEMKQI